MSAVVIDRPAAQHTNVPQLTDRMRLVMLPLKTVIILKKHTWFSAAAPGHRLPSAYCRSLHMPA